MTNCLPRHIGLLIESAINLDKLGRGYNAGYGHVKVISLQLIKRTSKKTLLWQENNFIVQEGKKEIILKDEVITTMNEWKAYVEECACG